MLFFCSVQFCVVEIVMNKSENKRIFFQCRVKVPKEPMLILEDMSMKLLLCTRSKIWHWLVYLLLNTVGSLGKCYYLLKSLNFVCHLIRTYPEPASEQLPNWCLAPVDFLKWYFFNKNFWKVWGFDNVCGEILRSPYY